MANGEIGPHCLRLDTLVARVSGGIALTEEVTLIADGQVIGTLIPHPKPEAASFPLLQWKPDEPDGTGLYGTPLTTT